MDPTYTGLPDFTNDIDFESMLPNSSQFPEIPNQYQFNQLSPDLDFFSNQFSIPPEPDSGNLVPPPISVSTEGESFYPNGGSFTLPTTVSPGVDSKSSDDLDFSETVFKYVNQMLMEENVEQKPLMLYDDPLGLRGTEKSFYDVLGQQYPFSPNQQPLYVDQPNQQPLYVDRKDESPDSYFSGNSSDFNTGSSPSAGTSNSVDSQSLGDYGEQKPSLSETSHSRDSVYQFNSHSNSNSQLSVPLTNSLSSFGGGMSESSVNQFLAQNIFTDSESVLQFQRGLEQASKFLPKVNPLVIDLESSTVSPEVKGHAPTDVINKEKSERKNRPSRRRGRRKSPNGSRERKNSPDGSGERKNSPDGSRGRKNHEREDVDSEEGRSSKQSAIYKEEQDELSEMFDKVLLFDGLNQSSCGSCGNNVDVQNEESKNLQPNGQPQASNDEGGKARAMKQGKKKETVDLRNLLILCAQAVSTNDFRTSTELLKQIRQHSSPFGDGSQRLAHFFANGLEARMAGTGTGSPSYYTSVASKRKAVDKLKCYQVSLSACPFKRMSIFFKNKMILKMAEKATTLHIVDFGILYGFQWPILIHKLSMRPGGPPKLRITGIEVPQPGFRPAEWIEETGRRLARYCERFNVPFEFNAIASQNWESIRVEDLKVERNEVLAVNCMLRFKNLLDETVEVNCPRDSVLKLIRRLKPDIFVHTIINGAYNAPFFVTRFREALFYFSALYDAFDVNIPRDSPERLMFETEFYGQEAINVIACEGIQRVERAETYKQWQVRCQRAGLQPLPLDQELVKAFRDKVKAWYHKDFAIDQDSDWILQAWKGRIVYASSCWVPA
ncbi:scarecrow-like protein 34 [Rosa sericea]